MEEVMLDATIENMQSQEIGKLALAISKAQGSFNGASKSSNNSFFKSKYADLFECIEAVKKPLADNELAVIQTTEPNGKDIDIITTLAHSSGQWIRGRMRMSPKKDDDQGRGSSITYGRRYAFAAIVGIAQKDDDGNGACEKPQKNNSAKSSCKTKQAKKTIEQIVDYIDSHCAIDPKTKKSKHSPGQLETSFNNNVKPILDQYTEDEQNRILSVYNDSMSLLKEGE